MGALDQALSKLDAALLSPKQQRPTLDQRFTQLLWEFQNFYNELTNTHLPWTHNSVTVNITGGTTDYLIPAEVSTILFAYAQPVGGIYGPVPLDIVDLAHISSDYYLFSPLDYGVSRDFNEALVFPRATEISFFKGAGGNYFRISNTGNALQQVTLVYATGNWLENLDPSSVPILEQYHMLPIVRACQNLLAGCEWADNVDRSKGLAATLTAQEQRYAGQFLMAKRSINADLEPSYRVPFGGTW